jgi:type II secretory pathway component PulJ
VVRKANRRSRSPHLRASRHAGFTLLEAIVAIVMFTFIIMAVSQAFSVAVQATTRSQHRQEDDGTVRAIFDVITRDILASYGAAHSPASVFMAGTSSGSSGSGDLLTFSALSNRLQTPELDTQTQSGAQSNNQAISAPQSDMALVKYTFDPSGGLLYRVVSTVPSSQSLSQSAPTPDQAIAQNIVNIQLSFWDSTQQSWRSDWDYEQQNQIGVVPLSSMPGDTGSSPAGPAGASQSGGTANTTATGDTYLPGAVKVTVTLQQSNGQTQDYVTTIPVAAPQTFIDPNQTANVNTTPTTSGSTSTSTTP